MFSKYLILLSLLFSFVLVACKSDQSANDKLPLKDEVSGLVKESPEKTSVKTKNSLVKTVQNKLSINKIEMTPKLVNYCKKIIKDSGYKNLNSTKICNEMSKNKACDSVKDRSIYHFDKMARDSSKGQKILVISLIHGDEVPSGQVSYSWIERLIDLNPRNTWRVIPMANPDGFFSRTRTNANKVDVNRNFPTADWEEKALNRWRTVKKKDPRKFPGSSANSQPETQCLVNHIKEFEPDFIISIHTPLGGLDFDGPKNINFPKFKPLPWISLGNYPGSLGRYMWAEQNVPVLTIELNNEMAVYNLEKFDKLQDISGTVAIQAIKKTKKKKAPKK